MVDWSDISRRDFVKAGAATAAGLAAAGTAVGPGKIAYNLWIQSERLDDRAARRPSPGYRWLTATEAMTLGALADCFIPADPSGPSGTEAGVVERIDGELANQTRKRSLYGRGLLAFDRIAEDRHGATFGQINRDRQLRILRRVERLYQEKRDAASSGVSEFEAKARVLRNMWTGWEPAADLFSALDADVKKAFYSSDVTWSWLGYDGPPFPRGYFGEVSRCPPVAS